MPGKIYLKRGFWFIKMLDIESRSVVARIVERLKYWSSKPKATNHASLVCVYQAVSQKTVFDEKWLNPIWKYLGVDFKNFLILISFGRCTSHFCFDLFYIVDFHSAVTLQVFYISFIFCLIPKRRSKLILID